VSNMKLIFYWFQSRGPVVNKAVIEKSEPESDNIRQKSNASPDDDYYIVRMVEERVCIWNKPNQKQTGIFFFLWFSGTLQKL